MKELSVPPIPPSLRRAEYPHCRPAQKRNVFDEQDEPYRRHPEAEDWQEPEESAGDEQQCERYP